MKRALLGVALFAAGFIIATAVTSSQSGPQYLNNPGRADSNPYSNLVVVGDTVYLAGSIGIDPATGAPPDKVEDEVKIVMDSMKDRLERVGMSMDDLVMVNVYCPDLTLYDRFNAVYRTYFDDHFPARAFLGSGPLLLGGHFEITGIAVKK